MNLLLSFSMIFIFFNRSPLKMRKISCCLTIKRLHFYLFMLQLVRYLFVVN